MPGLDEELVFRGLLLAFFVRAFGAGRELAGGTFGLAGVGVTFLFAAGHGLLLLTNGALVMNWHAFIVTGMIGAGLLWLRTRTGSLALPLVAHNLVNFGELVLLIDRLIVGTIRYDRWYRSAAVRRAAEALSCASSRARLRQRVSEVSYPDVVITRGGMFACHAGADAPLGQVLLHLNGAAVKRVLTRRIWW